MVMSLMIDGATNDQVLDGHFFCTNSPSASKG
jgi:hypothetical protein